jgi:hypothetical protein
MFREAKARIDATAAIGTRGEMRGRTRIAMRKTDQLGAALAAISTWSA